MYWFTTHDRGFRTVSNELILAILAEQWAVYVFVNENMSKYMFNRSTAPVLHNSGRD